MVEPWRRTEFGPIPTCLDDGNSRTSKKSEAQELLILCPLSRRGNVGGTKNIHEAARKLQWAHASVCGFVHVSPGTHVAQRCRIPWSWSYTTDGYESPIMGAANSLQSPGGAMLALDHRAISPVRQPQPWLPGVF